MIRLERPSDVPAYLQSDPVNGFRSKVKAFFSRAEQSRRQERPDFPLFPKNIFLQLLGDLAALSQGKCAYCESPIVVLSTASLDRYRPKAGALGIDGVYSTEHYWWLAYTWDNLYPACAKCNKFKGGKFPVQGTRAPREASPTQLAAEKRLLVDPFSDDPRQHLKFLENGSVVPLSSEGDVTIATFELNRTDLLESRRRVAVAVAAKLAKIRWTSSALSDWLAWCTLHTHPDQYTPPGDEPLPGTPFGALAQLASPDKPWSAVAAALLERGPGGPDQLSGSGKPAKTSSPALPRRAKASARKSGRTPTQTAPTARETTPEIFGRTAHERKLSAKAQLLRSRAVTRVAIHNFRGIRDLDLTIDYEKGGGAPWTILLGENAAGKSSVLQAVALTLIDADAGAVSATTPRQVLKKGTSDGWVRVWLDEATEPRVLAFSKRSSKFRRSGPAFSSVLLGYGATRLLPRGPFLQDRGRVRLDNMFDPFRPLLDANHWLGTLDAKSFDYVARALKDVLDLPRASKLKAVKRKGTRGVTLRLFGADLSLEDLSDGYQSVLGLTCDIIAGLHASSKGALEAAEGLVIIDELGAHLHPRWRMRIVESLRTAFRRVQFIASTHDPLCLRGLENGEVVVLRRTSRRRIYVVPDLPPIKGMRVDEILTSQYFGLESTMDPTIERKYREMYRLLALRKPTSKQEERITVLREELAPFNVPGATRRERRLLEIIDKELAETDEEPNAEKRRAIKGNTDRLVADLNAMLVRTAAT